MSYHNGSSGSSSSSSRINDQGQIAPPGYHYMPDGSLMANNDPAMLSGSEDSGCHGASGGKIKGNSSVKSGIPVFRICSYNLVTTYGVTATQNPIPVIYNSSNPWMISAWSNTTVGNFYPNSFINYFSQIVAQAGTLVPGDKIAVDNNVLQPNGTTNLNGGGACLAVLTGGAVSGIANKFCLEYLGNHMPPQGASAPPVSIGNYLWDGSFMQTAASVHIFSKFDCCKSFVPPPPTSSSTWDCVTTTPNIGEVSPDNLFNTFGGISQCVERFTPQVGAFPTLQACLASCGSGGPINTPVGPALLNCTYDQVSNEAKATVAPAYLGMGLPNQQSAAYVNMFNSGFFTFVNNMWAGYQNGGCNFWTNRVNHWTNQIANNSYNAYTLARKQAKILFAQNLHTICGCPGLPPAKITNIELDYSSLKQSGELRDFKIIGENGAKFKLEIKNEDSSYYNFYTNSFSSTYSFLEEEIKNGFYRGSITFPAVSDDDHYNINLFTLENTKHSTSIPNVDYTELRFDDGSIDVNNSLCSNSNLLEKIIYQYTTATLTMSAYSSSGDVSVHIQGTSDITVDKMGQKELTPFSFTVTAATTAAYRILKQPVIDDLITFVTATVGSVGIPLPGEDIFAGAARSSDKVVDGDFSGGATDITMDDDIGALWAVGDRVTGNAILDAKTGSSAVTITHVSVGGDAKVFTISESIAIADNETLTFTEPRYKRWEVDSKADVIKEGMLLVQGTNTEVGTKLADFEDLTLVNENTFKEEKIRSKIFKAVDTKGKKPTVSKGIVSAQEGEIIFDTPQRKAIAGTTLKMGGYGLEEVFRLTGYDVEFSELAIDLTTTTTTTTEASAGGSSADITVASAEGIISNVSRVGGIGINSALQNPLITSVDFAGKDLTMDAAQTLENGVTLTIENTSRVATISGKIKINKVGESGETLRFELDNLLSTSAPS